MTSFVKTLNRNKIETAFVVVVGAFSFINSRWDAVVLGVMLLGYAYIVLSMIRAHRPKHVIIAWGGFGALFFLLEFWLAPSGNTLSQNLIEVFGWRKVGAGTVIFALVLLLHWPDLARQIGAFRKRAAIALLNITDEYWEHMPRGVYAVIDKIASRFDPTAEEELRKQTFGDLYDADPDVMLKNIGDNFEAELREYANDKH